MAHHQGAAALMGHSISPSVLQEWNKTLEEEIPKRSNLHARGKALLILWDDASSSRRNDAEATKKVLERYQFEGETFFIPLEDSQNILQRRIDQFTDSINTDSSLALIYYSGNGNARHGHPYWQPDSKSQPQIDWFVVQEKFETTKYDCVFIMDCTYHVGSYRNDQVDASSCFRSVNPTPTGRMEILAAPSKISADDAVFRKALIKALSEVRKEPVSIDQLRRRVYRILGDALDPYYMNLSRGDNRSSITILPSDKVILDITIDKSLNLGNELGLKAWADKAPRQFKTFRFLRPETKGRESRTSRLSVQIDVASLGDINEKNISSWTKLAPPYVVDISVQGLVLSTKEKTSDERLDVIIQMWNQSSRLRTDLTTRGGQYKRIVVQPMKWLEDGFDDTSIIHELHDFCDVFRTHFEHCEVKPVYEIPEDEGLLKIVTMKMFEVSAGLKSSDLLVIVYNGHGRSVAQGSDQCILAGHGDNAEVDWTAVQPHLDEAACDVVQILDACFSGNAAKGKIQGKNEILTACERNERTPTGPDAYINRFTSTLKELINEAKPFTLLTVHNRLEAEVKQRKNDPKSGSLPLPAYKLKSESPNSITLRPRPFLTIEDCEDARSRRLPEEDSGYLGDAYAVVPVHSGDERRDWKDVGFARIFNAEEMMRELQKGIKRAA